jgi:molecular chaperone DnaJ
MNYYEILEVCSTATQKEIKQSYRRLVKQFHPDSHHHSANHDSIIEINTAYEILGDVQRRTRYDQQLVGQDDQTKRERRNRAAQSHAQQRRQASKQADQSLQQWMKNIYGPLNRLFLNVLNPLNSQIDLLAADPFDDELMADFEDYLTECHQSLEEAHVIFSSQPNPVEAAKIALSLYYCLNHLDDGLDELGQFASCYDEYYLHTGKELFRLARQLLQEAKLIAQNFG